MGSLPKNPQALADLANRVVSVIGTGQTNDYDVPSALVSLLRTRAQGLVAKTTTAQAAKADYRAAIADRDDQATDTTRSLSQVVSYVYANPGVTDAMISALGLVPRSKSRTPVVPIAPKDVQVAQQPDASVRIVWSRNGNAEGVIFIVESQGEDGEWGLVANTTAAKLLVNGYAFGETTYFRVSAAKNGLVSNPSPIATLYPKGVSPALRLAA